MALVAMSQDSWREFVGMFERVVDGGEMGLHSGAEMSMSDLLNC